MNNDYDGYDEVKSQIPVSEQLPIDMIQMTEHLFNYQTEKPIKKDTIQKYLYDIHTIRKIYDIHLLNNNFIFLYDFQKVLDIIKNKYNSINSISNIVNSIASILKRIPMYRYIYDEIYRELNLMISKEKQQHHLDSENKLSSTEKDKYLDWSTILEVEPKIEDTEDKLLFFLYTQIPPRRLDDFSHLMLISNDEHDNNKDNFVVVKDGLVSKIILNHYKTYSKYGKYVINDIPTKLNLSFIEHIKNKNIDINDFIFTKGRNNFSKKISSLFQKYISIPITVNILRHSFITYVSKQNLSTKMKKEIAFQMGHSFVMQDEYRRIEN